MLPPYFYKNPLTDRECSSAGSLLWGGECFLFLSTDTLIVCSSSSRERGGGERCSDLCKLL